MTFTKYSRSSMPKELLEDDAVYLTESPVINPWFGIVNVSPLKDPLKVTDWSLMSRGSV